MLSGDNGFNIAYPDQCLLMRRSVTGIADRRISLEQSFLYASISDRLKKD